MVVTARAFLHQTRGCNSIADLLGGPVAVARSQRLHIEVEAAGVLAVGAERELGAVSTAAAKCVNGLGILSQVFTGPAIAQAVIGAAGEAVKVKELSSLVAAGVHAVNDGVAARMEKNAAD